MDVHCDNCDAILDVTDDLFGKEIDCPGCGARFVAVPMPDAPPASPPLPPAPPPAPARKRHRLPAAVRYPLGIVLGLAIGLGSLYLVAVVVTNRQKHARVHDHSEYVRVILGDNSTFEERKIFHELLKLVDMRDLNKSEVERARTLRAELAIRHPGIAVRFIIGTDSITYTGL